MEKKKKILRAAGIIMIILGAGVLSFYGYRKISRELYLRKLLNNNINFEIPQLNIKVPVLEGTDSKALQVSAGHFEGTGALGKGNYCIAGYNSTIYAEIFNDLDQIQIGDEMCLELIEYITIDKHPSDRKAERDIHIYYKFLDKPVEHSLHNLYE